MEGFVSYIISTFFLSASARLTPPKIETAASGRGGLRLWPGMQVACWSAAAFTSLVGLRENDNIIY